MEEKLGNDVIKLQKEIMSISNKINSVRSKTHKSMSTILKGLKSFPKDKIYNYNSNYSSKKNIKKSENNKKIIDNNNYLIQNENNKDEFRNNNKIKNKINEINPHQHRHKTKRIKESVKEENGILLNEFGKNKSNHKQAKNYSLFDNLNNKKRNNRPIKCKVNKYRNYDFNNNNGLIDENYTFNDKNILKDPMLERKKNISKTDSLKYLYNNLNNMTNNEENENNYFQNIDYNKNYYKKDSNWRNYINKYLNNKINISSQSNQKSRNKSNEFKYKEKEVAKNNELYLDQKDFMINKESKTFYIDYPKDHNNIKSHNLNSSFSNNHNIMLQKSYTKGWTKSKSNKNFFREKALTRKNSKEKYVYKYSKYNDFNDYAGNKNYNYQNNNLNNIFQLLNVTNQEECLYKINKLLHYEEFIRKIKKLYFNFNDHNKDFTLKDILFWVSFNLNRENNGINKYEKFCNDIMRKFNIKGFENFKMFFANLINKEKNNDIFVKEMKQLFNSFNQFQPNKSIYKNESKKIFQNDTNEDDINNI